MQDPLTNPHNAPVLHGIVAFAHASDPACLTALRSLPGDALPHLHKVLQWPTTELQGGDGDSLNMPHEHALAQALDWPQADGYLPLAAWQSGTTDTGCAWLWPCHWQASIDHVMVQPTPQDQIDLATAEALVRALQPLAEEDGLQLSQTPPAAGCCKAPHWRKCAASALTAWRSAESTLGSCELKHRLNAHCCACKTKRKCCFTPTLFTTSEPSLGCRLSMDFG